MLVRSQSHYMQIAPHTKPPLHYGAGGFFYSPKITQNTSADLADNPKYLLFFTLDENIQLFSLFLYFLF